MPLKAIVDKIDDVEESYRGLYVERNGKFELSVELGEGAGVKSFSDFAKLNGGLVKERTDHKATKARLALLGERSVEDVVAILDRVPELEAAASGANPEKLNQMVEGRLTAKLAPVQRELAKAQEALKERDTLIQGFQTKERTRSIHDAVREVVGKAQGFQASALEDVLMVAERHFEVNEEGKVATRDGVGVTPGIAADVWLTEMQGKRAHWWGPTQGGGAGGNGGRGPGNAGANPFTAEGWNMTEQSKLVSTNRVKAEQLARSAGTSIGGPKPAAKK